jgi:hypothetical protein
MNNLFVNAQTFFKRRWGKKNEDDVNDETEFDGDEADNNPGKVSMNGGSHGTVFGINRKIITAIIVGGCLVIGMATIYNLTDDKDKEQGKPQQQAQETAANPDGLLKNDKNAVGSYDQLLDPKRQQMGKRATLPIIQAMRKSMGRRDRTVKMAIPPSRFSKPGRIWLYQLFLRLPILLLWLCPVRRMLFLLLNLPKKGKRHRPRKPWKTVSRVP